MGPPRRSRILADVTGDLAEFTMLDTRQYRDDQPCGDGTSSTCTDRLDPNRTLLGSAQREWLVDGFSRSRARWQVIGNQAPMGQTDVDPTDVTSVFLDPWDGYVADRNKVLAAAQDRDVRNLVVITGDRHQNYAWDLKRDYAGCPDQHSGELCRGGWPPRRPAGLSGRGKFERAGGGESRKNYISALARYGGIS